MSEDSKQVIEKPAAKRKTVTSSAVKARYNAKTYKRYTFSLRVDSDFELISEIEKAIENGSSPTEFVRSLYQKAKSL